MWIVVAEGINTDIKFIRAPKLAAIHRTHALLRTRTPTAKHIKGARSLFGTRHLGPQADETAKPFGATTQSGPCSEAGLTWVRMRQTASKYSCHAMLDFRSLLLANRPSSKPTTKALASTLDTRIHSKHRYSLSFPSYSKVYRSAPARISLSERLTLSERLNCIRKAQLYTKVKDQSTARFPRHHPMQQLSSSAWS